MRSQTPFVSRLVRLYLPLGLVVGTFTVLVKIATRPLDNDDTYFHLRYGHEFMTNWSLRDPGSVTAYASADWLPTQWLPQILMAWTADSTGLAGVAWLSGLQMCALAATMYWVARSQADPLSSALVLVLSILACGPFLTMRPQALSYIFIVVTAHAWLRSTSTGRPPWLLVPMTWVWAMCHGMWPIGILIGMAAAIAWSIDDHPSRHVFLRRLGVPFLSALAAALTPVGPRLYTAVFAVDARSDYFDEWQPPDFTELNTFVLGLMLAGTLTLALRHGRQGMVFTTFFLLAATMAVYAARTTPVAVAILVPLLADQLQRPIGQPTPFTRRETRTLAVLVTSALGILAAAVPHTADEPPPGQPAWVDRELGSLPPGTGMLSEWGWGGYLMWSYPHLDLVMHGYGDSFTPAELERNTNILGVSPGWDDLVQELGVTHALLSPESPLAYALTEQGEWTVLASSEDVELLVAPR